MTTGAEFCRHDSGPIPDVNLSETRTELGGNSARVRPSVLGKSFGGMHLGGAWGGGLEPRRLCLLPMVPWSVIDVKGRLAPLADPQCVCVDCKMRLYGGATKVLALLHFQDSNQMPPKAHRLSTRFNPNRPSIRSSHLDPTMWFAIHTTQDMSQHSP